MLSSKYLLLCPFGGPSALCATHKKIRGVNKVASDRDGLWNVDKTVLDKELGGIEIPITYCYKTILINEG